MSTNDLKWYEPEMPLEAARAIVSSQAAPRVTREGIHSRIADTWFHQHGTLITCVITMVNGFRVHGMAVPTHDRNFDPAVGQRLAYENAFAQIWALEGYVLKEFLYRSETPMTAEETAARDRQLYPLPSAMEVDFSEVYGVAKLPVWKSHKLVFAAKIVGTTTIAVANPSGRQEDDSGERWTLEGGGVVQVSHGLMARGHLMNSAGGYFVRYEDGYESWSPAAAFEGGYTRIG